MENKRQYEVALSFAGENRSYVERTAQALQNRGIDVFYDDFEKVELWGTHLVEEFQDVFENRANLALMFISIHYVEKAWPNLERRSMLSRAVKERAEYVLPVRFDDTLVPGLPTSISYLQADSHTPEELAAMVIRKLGAERLVGKASDVPPPRLTSPTGEAVFDYSNHNGRYVIGRGKLEFETKWSKASDTSIYIYNDPPSIYGVARAKGYSSIAMVSNAESLDYTSRVRTISRGEVAVLRNRYGNYAAIHVIDIKDDSRSDERDELRFQYAIQFDGSDSFAEFQGI